LSTSTAAGSIDNHIENALLGRGTTNGNGKGRQQKGVLKTFGPSDFGRRYARNIPLPAWPRHVGTNNPFTQEVQHGLLRTGAITVNALSNPLDQYTVLRDPYTLPDKLRYEDMFRTEPVIRTAILRKVQFTLGKKGRTVLDVVDDFETVNQLARQTIVKKQAKKNEMMQQQTSQFNDSLQNFINQLNDQYGTDESAVQYLQNQTPGLPPQFVPFPNPQTQAAASAKGFGSAPPTPSVRSQANRPKAPRTITPVPYITGVELPGTEPNAPEPPTTVATPPPQAQETIDASEFSVITPEPSVELDSGDINDYDGMKRQALEAVMSNQEYLKMKNDIDKINRKVGLYEKLPASVTQAYVYGRNAMFIEKDDYGVPTDLKVLNSMKMGQVFANIQSWQLEGIRYTDYQEPEDILAAEDIVYFTNLDYNVSPNTLWYGYSSVEPVVDLGETNRLIDAIDIKEIIRGLYAGIGIVRFDTKNDAEIQKLVSSFNPGLLTVTNLPFTLQMEKLAHDLNQIIEARNHNDLRIMRGIEIPSPLMGFEDVTNRATLEQALIAWKESVLDFQRKWIQDTLDAQWYTTLVSILLNEPDVEKLQVKVRQEFEDITFLSQKDRMIALLPAYQAGVIPLEKLLKELDMQDVIEQMQIEEERQEYQQQLNAHYQALTNLYAQHMRNLHQARMAAGGPTAATAPTAAGGAQQQPQPQQPQQPQQQQQPSTPATMTSPPPKPPKQQQPPQQLQQSQNQTSPSILLPTQGGAGKQRPQKKVKLVQGAISTEISQEEEQEEEKPEEQPEPIPATTKPSLKDRLFFRKQIV